MNCQKMRHSFDFFISTIRGFRVRALALILSLKTGKRNLPRFSFSCRLLALMPISPERQGALSCHGCNRIEDQINRHLIEPTAIHPDQHLSAVSSLTISRLINRLSIEDCFREDRGELGGTGKEKRPEGRWQGGKKLAVIPA